MQFTPVSQAKYHSSSPAPSSGHAGWHNHIRFICTSLAEPLTQRCSALRLVAVTGENAPSNLYRDRHTGWLYVREADEQGIDGGDKPVIRHDDWYEVPQVDGHTGKPVLQADEGFHLVDGKLLRLDASRLAALQPTNGLYQKVYVINTDASRSVEYVKIGSAQNGRSTWRYHAGVYRETGRVIGEDNRVISLPGGTPPAKKTRVYPPAVEEWLNARNVPQGEDRIEAIAALCLDPSNPTDLTRQETADYFGVSVESLNSAISHFRRINNLQPLSPAAAAWLANYQVISNIGKIARVAELYMDATRPAEITSAHMAVHYGIRKLGSLDSTISRLRKLRNMLSKQFALQDQPPAVQAWFAQLPKPDSTMTLAKVAALFVDDSRPADVKVGQMAAYYKVKETSLKSAITRIRLVRIAEISSPEIKVWFKTLPRPEGAQTPDQVAAFFLDKSRPVIVTQTLLANYYGIKITTLYMAINRLRAKLYPEPLSEIDLAWLNNLPAPDKSIKPGKVAMFYFDATRPAGVKPAHLATRYNLKRDSVETAIRRHWKKLRSVAAWLNAHVVPEGPEKINAVVALFEDPACPAEVTLEKMTVHYDIPLETLEALVNPAVKIKQEPEEVLSEDIDDPEIIKETLFAIKAEGYCGPIVIDAATGQSATEATLGDWQKVEVAGLRRLPADQQQPLLAAVKESVRTDGQSDAALFNEYFEIKNDPDDPVGNQIVAKKTLPAGKYLGIYSAAIHRTRASLDAAISRQGTHATFTYLFAARQENVYLSGYEHPNHLALINTANLAGFPFRGENNVQIFYAKKPGQKGTTPIYVALTAIEPGEELKVSYGPDYELNAIDIANYESQKNEQIEQIAKEKDLNIIVIEWDNRVRICTPAGWQSASIGAAAFPVDKLVALRVRQNKRSLVLYDALRMPEKDRSGPATWPILKRSRDTADNLFDALARGISRIDQDTDRDIEDLKIELSGLVVKREDPGAV